MLLYDYVNEILEWDFFFKIIWGNEDSYVGCIFDVFVFCLCKKFEGDFVVKIINVWGVGYKLVFIF